MNPILGMKLIFHYTFESLSTNQRSLFDLSTIGSLGYASLYSDHNLFLKLTKQFFKLNLEKL